MATACARLQILVALTSGLGQDEQDLRPVRQGLNGPLVQGDLLSGGHARYQPLELCGGCHVRWAYQGQLLQTRAAEGNAVRLSWHWGHLRHHSGRVTVTFPGIISWPGSWPTWPCPAISPCTAQSAGWPPTQSSLPASPSVALAHTRSPDSARLLCWPPHRSWSLCLAQPPIERSPWTGGSCSPLQTGTRSCSSWPCPQSRATGSWGLVWAMNLVESTDAPRRLHRPSSLQLAPCWWCCDRWCCRCTAGTAAYIQSTASCQLSCEWPWAWVGAGKIPRVFGSPCWSVPPPEAPKCHPGWPPWHWPSRSHAYWKDSTPRHFLQNMSRQENRYLVLLLASQYSLQSTMSHYSWSPGPDMMVSHHRK